MLLTCALRLIGTACLLDSRILTLFSLGPSLPIAVSLASVELSRVLFVSNVTEVEDVDGTCRLLFVDKFDLLHKPSDTIFRVNH